MHADTCEVPNLPTYLLSYKTENSVKLEPIEEVTIEVNDEHVGLVMEALSHRRAEVTDMGPVPGNVGTTRMSLTYPSRYKTENGVKLEPIEEVTIEVRTLGCPSHPPNAPCSCRGQAGPSILNPNLPNLSTNVTPHASN
ncbi:hypothetical protein U1Q18_013335 [Sarracenia purpurea var. burkii]